MLDSTTCTRRVFAGDRVLDGKRYAIEAEAVVFVTSQSAVDTDRHVSPAVLDQVQEMLHKSLATFARRGFEPVSSSLPEDSAGTVPGNQDYNSLIDCVIAEQRDADLPIYLLDLAGNLKHEVDRAAGIRERLVFVITGQMIEADIESGGPASTEP